MSVRPLTVVRFRDFFRGFFQQRISPITTKPRSSVGKILPTPTSPSLQTTTPIFLPMLVTTSLKPEHALFFFSLSLSRSQQRTKLALVVPELRWQRRRGLGSSDFTKSVAQFGPHCTKFEFFLVFVLEGPNSDLSFFVANFRHSRKIFSKENNSVENSLF
jgi:hypothetical protein